MCALVTGVQTCALPIWFDPDTIRKHGKSRYRDGGRDIEILDMPRPGEDRPRKWIFQCKLVSGKGSLDRKSGVEGKRVAVRVDLGGRRIIKKTNITTKEQR